MRLVTQAYRSDAGRDIEPGIAFEADRLKRDRAVGAADQHIRTGPDSDRGASGRADIISRERTRRQIGGRAENRPNEHAALRIAHTETEFVDASGTMFWT